MPGMVWIMKPAMGSSGRGISIADDGAHLERAIEEMRAEGTETMVIQSYIARPFLLHRHKFDIRVYLLIASVDPLVCFYHDGYLRVNAEPYDPSNTANSFAHITNFHVAVKHPDYDPTHDRVGTMDVRWSFTDFEQYIDQMEDHIGGAEMLNGMRSRMKDILFAVMGKMKEALHPQEGCFALLGVDFLLDANERLWLLEFTKNPALRSNTPHLAELHTGLVQHIVDIALDISSRKASAEGASMDGVGESTTFQLLG
jgi:tubulin polyglutamylase TTLL5